MKVFQEYRLPTWQPVRVSTHDEQTLQTLLGDLLVRPSLARAFASDPLAAASSAASQGHIPVLTERCLDILAAYQPHSPADLATAIEDAFGSGPHHTRANLSRRAAS